MSNALMLTGTINPAAYNNTNVVLTDAEERLKQYERAITYYDVGGKSPSIAP